MELSNRIGILVCPRSNHSLYWLFLLLHIFCCLFLGGKAFSQVISADQFEPDGQIDSSATISTGNIQRRTIHNSGNDTDVITFVMPCVANVAIGTSGVTGDTVLEVIDQTNGNAVASDDDSGVGLFSLITVSMNPGVYSIEVTEFGQDDEIEYNLFYTRSCSSTPKCNGKEVTVNFNLGETTGPGDDVVLGTDGPDDIRGKAGNDTICGMGGDDFIHGNSGDDWIDGQDGVDNIRGGRGNDVLHSGVGATLFTSSRIFGGDGSDVILGGPDDDDLRGGRGDDIITGAAVDYERFSGIDYLYGNADDDNLISGFNASSVQFGGGGDDILNGSDFGIHTLDGGSGLNDTCRASGFIAPAEFINCEVIN